MLRSFALMLLGLLLVVGGAAAQTRDLPMLVDPEWLADHLDVEELIVVHVDQRRDAYDKGRIPGARFLASERIAIDTDAGPAEIPPVELLILALSDLGIHDDTYVVVYGAPLAAARAWATLDYVGIGQRSAILDGGLDAWKAAGLPLSTAEPEMTGGTLSLWPERYRVVEADWVLERLEDPEVVLIDARSPDEYSGEDGGRGQYTAGHIPGARHIFWEELIHSREDPRLLPEEDLRARFEAAGAGPDALVVVYCLTGTRASLAYFVSRLLGYETRLYDGSWHDWSAKGLPAETGRG
jgi:thiosulfate/3-mercaptopyruvate sulfurtransferase